MEEDPQGLIRPHHSKLALLYRVSDALIILATLRVSASLYGIPWSQQYFTASVLAMALFYVFGESMNLYRSWRGAPIRQYVQPVVVAWVLTGVSLFLLAWMTKTTGTYSRVTVGAWMLGAPTCLIAWRIAIRTLLSTMRAKGFNSRRVAIAGANENGNRLARTIKNTPSLGLNLVGFFEDRGAETERVGKDLAAPLLGNFRELVEHAQNNHFDLVYITLAMKGEDRISQLISELSDTTASVYIVPDFFIYDLLHSRWVNVGEIPTISIFESPFYGVDGWAKRFEDIVLSSIILAIVSTPMLIIAAAVKLTSPGPIIFKQRRYGLDGRQITVWKFRTMRVQEDGEVVKQATKNDDRVTPIGAFLRRTSLDELPQFFNVLSGEMSIVGPRPHAVAHNEEYRKLIDGYMLRHKVKPGITGWAQINGWRGETDTLEKMQRRVEFDLWYIRSWSVWLDLRIVFQTLARGFVNKNAY